jgi:hypothetical protein
MGRFDQVDVHVLLAGPRRSTFRLALFATALAAAACAASLVDQDLPAPVFDHPPSFDIRFNFGGAPVVALEKSALHPLARTLAMEMGRLERAKLVLAQKLLDARAESAPFSTQRIATAIPVPRSRPAQADIDAEKARANGGSDQTLLQKIAGLFGGGVKLASLSPDAGLSDGIRALGVDDTTAVYDISARAVYMPGGARLEAHSGFGALRDSPDHVSERNVGATPPAVYELRPREQLFHGVQALRMIPADGQSTLGRDGLLTHSYMLGPDGDSNGCVSIRDYDKFLAAFQNGEVKRLLVVTSLSAAAQLNQIRS